MLGTDLHRSKDLAPGQPDPGEALAGRAAVVEAFVVPVQLELHHEVVVVAVVVGYFDRS